jgi:hypothetical protein
VDPGAEAGWLPSSIAKELHRGAASMVRIPSKAATDSD